MESNRPEYLDFLANKFEERIEILEVLQARISRITEKGIIVHLYGLYGFITFGHLPWNYRNHTTWQLVFPYLKDAVIYCKVYSFTKDPLSIVLNADFQQFKIPYFLLDHVYNGIIISVSHESMRIELGVHFNWRFGSYICEINRSALTDPNLIKLFEKGELIEVLCTGFDDSDNPIFGPLYEPEPDDNILLMRLLGQEVDVEVIIDTPDHIEYLVEKKYTGILPVTEVLYPHKTAKIKRWILKLENGDKIRGKVIKVNSDVKSVTFQWIDIDEYIKEYNSTHRGSESGYLSGSYVKSSFKLKDIIPPSTTEKIQILYTTVNVVVAKYKKPTETDINYYIVNEIYIGKLTVFNPNYHITNKEKELIESNLQNGEILKCKVMNLENDGTLTIQWTISDDELRRFIQT